MTSSRCSAAGTVHGTAGVRHAGLLWASKRWQWAQSLQLEMQESSSRKLADVLFRQQPHERPSSLNELIFICHSGASAAIGPSLLPWLASSTPALSVLLCSTRRLSVMPPLAQLKHLVLLQFSTDFVHVAEALPQLQSLQTVSLEYGRQAVRALCVLDLHTVGSLRQLNLNHVGATRIALPGGCRMSMRMQIGNTPLMGFSDLDWPAALPVLQSLQIAAYAPAHRPTVADLQACACLRDLSLQVYGPLGTEGAPWRLDGALARLDRVNLVALELVLTVPRGACWPVVRWHGSQRLAVTFEDVGAFAAAAKVFSFEGRWNSPSLAVLGDALTAVGKGWANSTLPSSDATGSMTAMHSLKHWCAEKRAHTDHQHCMCGACMRCLHRAGVLVAMPEHWRTAGVGNTPEMPQLFPDEEPHAGGHSSDEFDEEYDEEEEEWW